MVHDDEEQIWQKYGFNGCLTKNTIAGPSFSLLYSTSYACDATDTCVHSIRCWYMLVVGFTNMTNCLSFA